MSYHGGLSTEKKGHVEAAEWLGEQLRQLSLDEASVLDALGEFAAELARSDGDEPMDVARRILAGYTES
ncbi:MAG: hypothetical protein Q7S84_00845 [bacterium]|nr:hypothetical protein [bacterium]